MGRSNQKENNRTIYPTEKYIREKEIKNLELIKPKINIYQPIYPSQKSHPSPNHCLSNLENIQRRIQETLGKNY